MSDDKQKTAPQDRAQVNSGEDYEVDHLAKKHGVSPDTVRQAVQAVGKSRQKVEEYLRNHK